ncbi:PAAR domain-containing protein [Pasteurella multocida]|uniref:PAAR domain-containing protein n=1 Tax=Pasteurella multocida TaxID=747 RepID=UPI00330E5F44|nr:PAAR domain-containing protein [Pasteurella multocida]
MARKRAIVIGDKTTHGGVVLQGSFSMTVQGKAVSLQGDLVACPQCKGNFPIIEGAVNMSSNRRGVALEGMKTACGAELIGSQNLMWADDGKNYLNDNLIRTELNSLLSKENKTDDKDKKEIIELFWSYGEQYTRLNDISRHYTDLNLHVITSNYEIGETVEVSINFDKENGDEEFSVFGIVEDDGMAIIRNVFKQRTIFINGED